MTMAISMRENGSSITVTGSGDMAGIVSGSTTMENGSSIDVSSTSGSGSDAKVYGVRGGNLTMNGGSISVNSNSLPAYGSSAKATIKGSSVINVTGKKYEDGDHGLFYSADGIIVIRKFAVIPDGTVI